MDRLSQLRLWYAKPIFVSSGFRCIEHNNAIGGTSGSAHTLGKAADITIHSKDAYALVRLALQLGFPGVGVQQRGDWEKRFIHLDWLHSDTLRPRIWSY